MLAAKAESTESLTYIRVSSDNQNSPLGVEQSESNISLAEIIKKFNNQDKAKVQAESRLYLNAMKNRFKTMAAEYIRGKVLKQAGNINAYYRKAMEAAAKAAVCFESGDIYAAYDYKLQQLQFLAIAAEAIRVSKLTEKYNWEFEGKKKREIYLIQTKRERLNQGCPA